MSKSSPIWRAWCRPRFRFRLGALLSLSLLALVAVVVRPLMAERPLEKRDNGDYIVTGRVEAVYTRETKGYRNYIVEIQVEAVQRGAGLRKGATFRAFCYQRREGIEGSLEFDSAGHTSVPREGQRVRVYVNSANGRFEGVHPDWVDVLASPPQP